MTVPGGRGLEARDEVEQRGLADSRRAGHDSQARPGHEVEVTDDGSELSGIRIGDVTQLHRREGPVGSGGGGGGRLEVAQDVLESRGAVGGGVELLPDAADRPVGLGGEEDGDEGGAEVHRPVGEPQADGHRDDGDADRGEQLEGGRAEEGDAERLHRRPTVALADVTHHLDLTSRAPEVDEGGQPAHDVEEVTSEAGERGPTALGRVGRRAPDEGGEDGQQRHGQHDDERARPVDDRAGSRWP